MATSRRDFLRTFGATAAALGAGGRAFAQARLRRPNIVLMMADDMGYECVGAYGSSLSTPNLDRAAERGMLFRHAHSQPLCTPTRVQIMTGLYNNRNYEQFGYLNPRETTFGNLLRDAGYATCIAGKWQLSGDAGTVKAFGFDEHCLWNMHAYREGPGSPSAKEPGEWRKRYRDPCLYRNGEWIRPGADAYGPDVCCDFISSFMGRNRDKPFLVYYPMILTHSPFEPTPHSKDWNAAGGKGFGKQQHFADMVAYTDYLVGKIQSRLEELKLADDTVLVFTGDNGTHRDMKTPQQQGNPVEGGKGRTTDFGTHVPLIAWGKGIRGGVRSDALVDFTDVLPTLLDVADVAPPDSLKLDGHSLEPVLTGAEAAGRRQAVFCYYDPRWGKGRVKRAFARDREYKLYASGHFYNVANDPKEERDLSQGPLTADQKAICERLRAVVVQHLGRSALK